MKLHILLSIFTNRARVDRVTFHKGVLSRNGFELSSSPENNINITFLFAIIEHTLFEL